MTRNTIVRKNGTPSRYFWSPEDGKPLSEKTVFKQTTDGIKRMTGVHYDATANRMVKH